MNTSDNDFHLGPIIEFFPLILHTRVIFLCRKCHKEQSKVVNKNQKSININRAWRSEYCYSLASVSEYSPNLVIV